MACGRHQLQTPAPLGARAFEFGSSNTAVGIQAVRVLVEEGIIALGAQKRLDHYIYNLYTVKRIIVEGIQLKNQ